MTRNEILDFLKAHRDELRQTFGVQEIALFGSYARESANSESDIDIAVEIVFGLKRYLESHLGKAIDLGIGSAMKPAVKKIAQRDMLHVRSDRRSGRQAAGRTEKHNTRRFHEDRSRSYETCSSTSISASTCALSGIPSSMMSNL